MIVQNYPLDYVTEILKDLYQKTGQTPPQSLFDSLKQETDKARKRDEIVKSWQKPGGDVEFPHQIRAQSSRFVLSPARAVGFTVTTLANIPNNTYTAVDFTDTRGLINNIYPEGYGCIKRVEGYNDRFTKQEWVPAQYPIIFFGDFGFNTHATGSRDIYIEFFDKDDASLGGYTFSARAANTDWTNISFTFINWFDDGDYCKFWVWQDSGTALTITSANFGAFLG